MSNINTILSALDNLTEKNSFEVYLPSLKRGVMFKPLTAGQQHLLYLCVSDNVVYHSKFIFITYDIIKENCLEQDLIDKLTVIDRIVILLALRKDILTSNILIESNGEQYLTNFNGSFDYAASVVLPENKTIERKNIQIELQVPLMLDQHGVEKELRVNSVNTLLPEDTIKDLIINESCKFIKEVYIDSEKINYSSFSYTDRLSIVSKLPADFMYDIQDYASEVNEIQTKLLSVKMEDGPELNFDLTVDFFLDR